MTAPVVPMPRPDPVEVIEGDEADDWLDILRGQVVIHHGCRGADACDCDPEWVGWGGAEC